LSGIVTSSTLNPEKVKDIDSRLEAMSTGISKMTTSIEDLHKHVDTIDRQKYAKAITKAEHDASASALHIKKMEEEILKQSKTISKIVEDMEIKTKASDPPKKP
jgi:DNA repair ATPase RecN